MDGLNGVTDATLSPDYDDNASGDAPPPVKQDVGANDVATPAPVGDPKHPAIVLRDGFYRFRDEYRLPAEPTVDEAITRYLGEVEKAFQNVWPLHPNLIKERTDAEKIKHAFDLDFRENEIKRLREILPVDKPVFDYIDVFVDVVLLGNLKIFVEKRLRVLRQLTLSVWFIVAAAAVSAFLFVHQWMTAARWQPVSAAIGLSDAVLRPTVFIALALLAAIVVGFFWWRWFVHKNLVMLKNHYDDAARDAANLVALKLADKGHEVENLMKDIKSRLETLASPDLTRVQMAPKLVRILLWNPERMGLIENYYRAKMDQFMMSSARVSIAGAVKRTRLLWETIVFNLVLAISLLAGNALVANATAGDKAGFVTSASDFLSSLGSLNLPAFDTLMETLRPFQGVLLIPLAALVACPIAYIIARYSREYQLPEAAAHSSSLVNGMIGAAAAAAVVGAGLAFAGAFNDAAPYALYLLALVALVALFFAIRAWFAYLILFRYDATYSSNVLAAIEKKMDASQWTRYSDLRVDEQIAEVFGAVYYSWYNETRKGIFGSPRSGE